jgi:hypothetical protein
MANLNLKIAAKNAFRLNLDFQRVSIYTSYTQKSVWYYRAYPLRVVGCAGVQARIRENDRDRYLQKNFYAEHHCRSGKIKILAVLP